MDRRTWGWIGVGMLTVAACQKPAQVAIRDPSQSISRHDCPKEWQWDSTEVSGLTLSAPDEIQNVPEFHDCQRFIVPDSTTGEPRYDGLFAIFATSRFGRLDTLQLMDSLRADPRFEDALRRLVDTAGFEPTAGLPSAEIWAPESSYEWLDIEEGFSCLYLYLRGNPPNRGRWMAKIVPFGRPEQDCSTPVDVDTLPGTNLSVHPDLGAPPDSVPRVARWDRDPENGRYYIGIFCGNRWCEVTRGDVTLASSKRFLKRVQDQVEGQGGQDQPPGKQRVYGIRGWYDEQYLAVSPDSETPPRPTRILGTVIPDSMLGLRDTAYFTGDWKPAAEVALLVPEGEVNHYDRKLNLAATNDLRLLNKIELCHGASCPDVGPAQMDSSRTLGWGYWFARIIRPDGGATQTRLVRRCNLDTADVEVPGTARWRWLANDETLWMRCAKGCCEVY